MPAGGSHPNPAAACEQLSEADGRIEDIPEDPGPCTREFNPVILAASGTWYGQERRFEREFANRCVGIRATGGVIFDFEGTADAHTY
jgi:Subtilisin inhibitor-like